MQNQNLIESSRYNGTHAFNPNIPPPQTLRQEDEYLNAFLSDDQRTSTKNARTLLKDIAQISTIKGRLEADREFFSASWPRGFEVDERNASMITMKEAKEYFQDNKFGGDPVEHMDFVADFVGSTHNNHLLSVQEKSNVLRFACSEVVRNRCGLVHATTLGRYKEMIECIFKRYGSNLEYEDAYARKIQMLDPIKLHETRNLNELVGIMRQFRMVSGSDHSKLIMNSAKKLVPEELYTLFGMENRIKLRKTVKDLEEFLADVVKTREDRDLMVMKIRKELSTTQRLKETERKSFQFGEQGKKPFQLQLISEETKESESQETLDDSNEEETLLFQSAKKISDKTMRLLQ